MSPRTYRASWRLLDQWCIRSAGNPARCLSNPREGRVDLEAPRSANTYLPRAFRRPQKSPCISTSTISVIRNIQYSSHPRLSLRSLSTCRSNARFSNYCLALLAGVFIWIADAPHALALDPKRAISQYVHQSWGPEQGLLGGDIYSIGKSPDGYLWLGTDRGLVRF